MKLEQITEPEAYLHCERYVNQRKYSKHSEYSEVSEEYRPREGQKQFRVPYFWLKKDVTLLTANPSPEVLKQVSGDGIRFCLHPEMLKESNPTIDRLVQHVDGYLTVTPTASTRTVYCEQPAPMFLKLHLNKRISRYVRRLKGSSVEHSTLISQDFEQANTPPFFAYLPESIGVIAGRGKDAIGMIYRETTPRPLADEKRHLVPYFSLWSPDDANPQDPPLLVQLINHHNANPREFFLEKIIEPLIASWAWATKERGILLESHGQNALLELDKNYNPTRVVHRDFQSLEVDPKIRAAKGLSMPFTKHRIGIDDPPRKIEYSLVYDVFVGDYLFSHIVKPMTAYFGIKEETLKQGIRDLFQQHFPDWKRYFPVRSWYKLGPNILPNNESEIVKVKTPAEWRCA